ncbi:MAG: glycolate oxidase subunit glcE [Thermomicrobiales bacterium]|nr:glycolate oxidase subunit glcE [Thermomicrobiales bacterium]
MPYSESGVGRSLPLAKSGVEIVSIDGIVPSEILVPDDAQETAEVLASAAGLGKAVAPVGGGTALNMGNPPERVDCMLSTEHLAGIIDYEPTDLVLSVGAGARFGDVQAVLAEHGQRLPLDPPGAADATIGGLIATGRWGPLRYSAGTLRDLLIGISVAHPSGTVSKAGGMVVKNVSGYDMPRLYLGSLGTLGVVVSANFKVLPRPRAEATVIVVYNEPQTAFSAANELRHGHEPIAALEVAFLEGAWHLAARVEGREETVDSVAGRIGAIASGDATSLEGPESARWWASFVAKQHLAQDETAVLVRCGVRPKETAVLVTRMAAALNEIGIATPYLAASPGLGAVVAQLDFGREGSSSVLAEAQGVLLGLADTATILTAPPAWKHGIDVWGRLPEGFDVMRSLREQFDPKRTINPGRFAGFL